MSPCCMLLDNEGCVMVVSVNTGNSPQWRERESEGIEKRQETDIKKNSTAKTVSSPMPTQSAYMGWSV